MIKTFDLPVVLHDALFKAYGGIFVLDDKADSTLLEKLSEICPGKFSFEHIDGAFKIIKCDQVVILEIFKLDRDVSTRLNALMYDRNVSYDEELLTFLDKFFDYMNSFETVEELMAGLLTILKVVEGGVNCKPEVRELLNGIDNRVLIILRDILLKLSSCSDCSKFRKDLMYSIYSVLVAIGHAVKFYASKLGSPNLNIVFGDKITGPIFEQINDKYLNGVKVLNVEVNGIVKQHLAYISNMLTQTGNKVYYIMTGENTGAMIVIACNGFEVVYDK